jgi:hypothetical protein
LFGILAGTAVAILSGMKNKPYDIRERTYLFTRESILTTIIMNAKERQSRGEDD